MNNVPLPTQTAPMIIRVEGPSCCGKTTIVKMLQYILVFSGRSVKVFTNLTEARIMQTVEGASTMDIIIFDGITREVK